MKNSKLLLQLISCGVACWLIIGCVSTKYVERKQYLLDTPKNLAQQTTPVSPSYLLVERVSALAPFDQLDFLYRIESGRYLIDYYNGFLVTPTEQLDSILRAYLKSHINCNINGTAELPVLQNRLQVKLIELYADYRVRNKPCAVIALQFYLTTMVDGKTVILADRVFRSNVALKEKNTASLLQAWNVGLQNILVQGTRMLNLKVKR